MLVQRVVQSKCMLRQKEKLRLNTVTLCHTVSHCHTGAARIKTSDWPILER